MQSVCVFGDSVSKGIIFDNMKKRYFILKDNFINLFFQKKNMKVSNYSKLGCTITKAEGIFQKHLEDLDTENVVFFELGGNDCDFDWKEVSLDPNGKHIPKTPLEEFEKHYISLIRSTREKGACPYILNLPPLDENKYFQWISKDLDKDNILKFLGGSTRYIYRWHEMYNMCVCKIANEMQVPLIDIRSAFLQRTDYSDMLCEDGIHPNEKGHKLINEAIQNSLVLA